MPDQDTIAAVSTAPGPSAIAVVRISGPETAAMAGRLGIDQLRPRHVELVVLRHPEDGRRIDRVLALRFAAPASYTGEDMLELSCHGGSLVPQLVLDSVCAAGARLARPGEFTRRAFLNGKIDLLQAEATLDLIESRSPAMHHAALLQLERGLSKRVDGLRGGLIGLQALIAYDIDFPEEDDGPVPAARIDRVAADLEREIEVMLSLAPEGELLREGALTVIAGKPNVGKSSIFNLLLGFERAIVTEEPGTTRDAIEALIGIEGYPFRLVDTAGLRAEAQRVEGLGIEVARSYLDRADLILMCVEAVRNSDDDETEFVRRYGAKSSRIIELRTKCDLVPEGSGVRTEGGAGILVSARTGEGVPALRAALLEAAYREIRRTEAIPLVTRERQARCLRRAAREMEAFRDGRARDLPSEIVATHLQEAALALEDLLGAMAPDDVLDAVFAGFCVGK